MSFAKRIPRILCLWLSWHLCLGASAIAAEAEIGFGSTLHLDSVDYDQDIAWAQYSRSVRGTSLTGRFDQQWRFDESDQLWSLTAGRSLSPRWTLSGRVAGSTDRANLFPHHIMELTPYFLISEGWLASLSIRHSRFPDDTSLTAVPGIEFYLGNYRFAYSAFITRVHRNVDTTQATVDPLATASSLKIDRYYRYSSRIGAGLSAGTERDWNSDSGKLSESTQVGFVVDGLHGWSPTWATSWQLQGRDHSRLGLQGEFRLGVRYRY